MASRLGKVIVAFLVSAFVAGAVLGLLTFMLAAPSNLSGPLDGALRIVGLVALATIVVGAIAVLPAIMAIVLAEWFTIRHPIYFAAWGGLVPLLLYLPVLFGDGDRSFPRGLGVICVIGLFAGLLYWHLAGRNSGKMR